MNREIIDNIFSAIDNRDATAFASFFADDGSFRFANLEPVKNKENVTGFVKAFFDGINGIGHEIEDFWSTDNAAIIRGRVEYTRKDDSVLPANFCTVIKHNDGEISDYLVYVDASELFPKNMS